MTIRSAIVFGIRVFLTFVMLPLVFVAFAIVEHDVTLRSIWADLWTDFKVALWKYRKAAGK